MNIPHDHRHTQATTPSANMTAPRKKAPTGIRRSRRNLIKIGAIAASAIFGSFANAQLAAAQTVPGGNGQGGNGQGGNGQGGNGQGGNGQGGNGHCFLKGTTIRAADGDRKIEDLAVGDLLPTVFGGACPIQWIGRYPFRKSDPKKGWVQYVLPVRIARSALGPGVPHADLCVTKAHALFIDDVLVPAGDLVNGTTITVYDARELDELEFFHIKLERHNVIYAEGAPCETVMQVDESAVNFAEYLRRYGHGRIHEAPCAPLLSFNGGRNELKSRFRSALSPWIDRRQTLDIIRDEIEERGIALLRQPELMS
jgi:Hint domain